MNNVSIPKSFTRSISTLALALAPATALAHPGHGTTDPGSVAHYLLDPVHAMIFGVATCMAVFTAVGWRRRRRASP